MTFSSSMPLCSIPPGSRFCSGCSIGDDCPNTDTGPEEPDLTQYGGFYTDVSNIGDFTLSEFAHMTFKQFSEIGYANETVVEHFFRLQAEIKSVIGGRA